MRTAEAKLSMTVEDGQLEAHIKRLEKVQALWSSLKKGGESLKGIVPDDVEKGFGSLNRALTPELAKNAGDVAKSLQSLSKYGNQTAKTVQGLGSALTAVGVGLEGFGKGVTEASAGVGKLAASLKNIPVTDLREQAQAFGSAGKNIGKMGDRAEKASLALVSLEKNAKAVQAAVTPFAGTLTSTDKALAKKAQSLDKVGLSLKKIQQDLIRNASLLFIAYHWVKGAVEKFR
jgi:ABC-type transporter Mla subunit MlaD